MTVKIFRVDLYLPISYYQTPFVSRPMYLMANTTARRFHAHSSGALEIVKEEGVEVAQKVSSHYLSHEKQFLTPF